MLFVKGVEPTRNRLAMFEQRTAHVMFHAGQIRLVCKLQDIFRPETTTGSLFYLWFAKAPSGAKWALLLSSVEVVTTAGRSLTVKGVFGDHG